ncbi:MAG: SEC-C domain-containing protein [Bradymonadaceae bacterium]|nr:SEC-C domain-containing protein [Lujinxingiaceae bacterium]
MALGASLGNDFRMEWCFLRFFFACLPWIARTEAQDLFLPAAFACHHDQAAEAVKLLVRHHQVDQTPQPTRVERSPGRNDACNCGSGKKFKQCCMRASP